MNALQVLLEHFIEIFQWVVFVAPWESALRVRAGKWVAVLDPGPHLRIPFVDRVYRQSIRRRMSIIRPQTLTCADGKTVTVAAALAYSIQDLRTLFDTLDDAEDSIEAEVASRVAAAVALDKRTPRDIEEYVRRSLNLRKYGLADQEFAITSFAIVRTYRLITGEIPSTVSGTALDTNLSSDEQWSG